MGATLWDHSRALSAIPSGGRGGGLKEGRQDGHCPCMPALLCPHAASQLVTMHDLKQGLGSSGVAGPRKLISNKYKLKVGVLELLRGGRGWG